MSSGSSPSTIGLYQPGDTFGRFSMREKLGSGGSAEVYRAYDAERSAEVVLKVVPEDLDEKSLRRFVAETRILSRLNHPNVVKIYEVGETDGRHYYVMEYVEADSLKQLIEQRCDEEKGFFSLEEVLSLSADLTSALCYTHTQNIFHRDIKPANILVDKSFKAILMDFGVAKSEVVSVHTETGSLLGTPLYMSPEQLQGKKVDALSDIYSLGLVIYQTATGALPFQCDNPYTSATRRLTEDVPPPSTINPTISPVLEKIILKCLHRDKRNRFQSAEAMLRSLQSVPGFPEEKRSQLAASSEGASEDEQTVEVPKSTPHVPKVVPTKGKEELAAQQTLWLGVLAALILGMLFLGSQMGPKQVEYVYGSLSITPGTESVEISLRTTPSLRCEFLYGPAGATANVAVISPTKQILHQGKLTGLKAGTVYNYKLRFIGDEGRLVETGERRFRTLRHHD